jgi:hypothetical protein
MLNVPTFYDSFFQYAHRSIQRNSSSLSISPVTSTNKVAYRHRNTTQKNNDISQRKKTTKKKTHVDITEKGQWINEYI